MTWWAWLMQLAGWGVLALSMWLVYNKARREKALRPWALLLAVAGAAVSAVLFIALSPSRPPAGVIVLMALLGAFAGVGISLAARLTPQGKTLFSSQGQWYAPVWCGFLFLASLLIIAGRTASQVAVAIAVCASLAAAAYTLTIYLRYASHA